MEEALVAHLLASAGLSSLVDDRVHLGKRPQGFGLPAVVLHRISGAEGVTLDGPDGLGEARIQVDCWAGGWLAAKEVARAVKAAVSGLNATVGDTKFQGVFVISERDDFDHAPPEQLHRSSLDLQVWHAQA